MFISDLPGLFQDLVYFVIGEERCTWVYYIHFLSCWWEINNWTV